MQMGLFTSQRLTSSSASVEMLDMLPTPTAKKKKNLEFSSPWKSHPTLTQDLVLLCGVAALQASSLRTLTGTDGLLPVDASHVSVTG